MPDILGSGSAAKLTATGGMPSAASETQGDASKLAGRMPARERGADRTNGRVVVQEIRGVVRNEVQP